jgi:PRTRC genetic system protein A
MTKDEIIRKRFPTLMVPREEPLLPCPVGETRLLMAADGLYVETNQPWGKLTRRLWGLSRIRPLPYGIVEEVDGFFSVLKDHIMPVISACMVADASAYARGGNEWAGLTVWNGGGCYYLPVPFKTSRFRAEDIIMPRLPEGHYVAGDVHSHHRMAPSFSPIDDKSDSMGARISVVLGNFRDGEYGPRFEWKARYCVQGFMFSDNITCGMEAKEDDQTITDAVL